MAARIAHQPARRIRLQPPLVLPSIPHTVLRAEHPPTTFAIEHGEVAHGEAKRARLQPARATFLDQRAVSRLGLRKGVDCHGLTVSRERKA